MKSDFIARGEEGLQFLIFLPGIVLAIDSVQLVLSKGLYKLDISNR